MPRISLLVTCFNKLQFVSQFENQLLDLLTLLPEVEVIIVDDSSSDGSDLLLKELASKIPQIVYLRNQLNLGSAASRNLALKRSTSRLVFFWDIDDLIVPTVVRYLLEISENENIEICGGQYNSSVEGQQMSSQNYLPLNTTEEMPIWRKQFLEGMGYWRYIYSKDFLELIDLEFLPTFIQMKSRFILDDVFWMLMISATNAKFFLTDEVVYIYSTTVHSGDSWRNFQKQAKQFPKAALICLETLKQKSDLFDFDYAVAALMSKTLDHLRYVRWGDFISSSPSLVRLIFKSHGNLALSVNFVTSLFGVHLQTIKNSIHRLIFSS